MVIEWDDCIFPSTCLNLSKEIQREDLPEDMDTALTQYEAAVTDFLLRCEEEGEVILRVKNLKKMERQIQQYLPVIKPIID